MNGARRHAMAAGGAAKERLCRAAGGRVCRADGGAVDDMAIDGASPKPRSDRPSRAGKDKAAGAKGTTVNVIVAPKDGSPSPVPSASPAAGTPPPPLPRPPMMPPPGVMPRATGGRVTKAHPDEAQDRVLFKKMFREEEAKPHREGRATGGRLRQHAGMESAVGRAGRPPVRP